MNERLSSCDMAEETTADLPVSRYSPLPEDGDDDAYDEYIAHMRQTEYPSLSDPSPTAIYLDHAGTTPYSATHLRRFHQDMLNTLYGNPHSSSPSSLASTQVVEDVRLRALRLFNASPADFDLVFVANATAGMKLVGEALREAQGGFEFAYCVEAHTSLVGLREGAGEARCLGSDQEVWRAVKGQGWGNGERRTRLLGFAAQSNMNGRRLPWGEWCRRVHELEQAEKTFTLLDAAAWVSSSPLDLGDVQAAPDFTALSFYKIFGFPDLGALIVKKTAAHVFERRRYFGGGSVDMVVCLDEQWHARKSGPLHGRLEDGTLPVHSILALGSAMQTHEELYGSLDRVSRHTASLAKKLHNGLRALEHGNGASVCVVRKHEGTTYGDPGTQGPIAAFNLRDAKGDWVRNTEFEKLASVKNIHLRTGGVCNPGGVASALNLAPWEMRENFSAGHRCGSENDVLNGKPTGVIRVSLGAMSTRSDVEGFLTFIDEFFVCKAPILEQPSTPLVEAGQGRLCIESLNVYPIKSCAGWTIPPGQTWDIRPEGLAWDREWCVVHQGTLKALSQKQYPRMALIRPSIDFKTGVLRIRAAGKSHEITVPLSKNPTLYTDSLRHSEAELCGDPVDLLTYDSPAIAQFLTTAIGVPCTLARFNPASTISRHSKPHLAIPHPRSNPSPRRPITFTNESPILTITRSSLNRLNETIKLASSSGSRGGKAAHPSVFRANIVLAESPLLSPGAEQPWAEDEWTSMRVGGSQGPTLEFLGGCRRCQMVCVDQESGERDKDGEPFVTLAKTRRYGGRVLFGVHTALVGRGASVMVGEGVETFRGEEEGKGED